MNQKKGVGWLIGMSASLFTVVIHQLRRHDAYLLWSGQLLP